MGKRKVVTETIDGLEVTTQQMPPMTAAGLNFRLGRVLAPVLAQLGGLNADDDVSFEVVGPALVGLFGALDETSATKLIRDLLASTMIIGVDDAGAPKKFDLSKGDVAINAAFEGADGVQLVTLYRVVWFAMKVCFGDFIDAASAGMKALGGDGSNARAKASPST